MISIFVLFCEEISIFLDSTSTRITGSKSP